MVSLSLIWKIQAGTKKKVRTFVPASYTQGGGIRSWVLWLFSLVSARECFVVLFNDIYFGCFENSTFKDAFMFKWHFLPLWIKHLPLRSVLSRVKSCCASCPESQIPERGGHWIAPASVGLCEEHVWPCVWGAQHLVRTRSKCRSILISAFARLICLVVPSCLWPSSLQSRLHHGLLA